MIWVDGASSWVAWRIKAKAAVTAEWAPFLANHRVGVQVWNSKDKFTTARAKIDKPKRFKMLSESRQNLEEITRDAIQEIAKDYEMFVLPRLPDQAGMPRLPHNPPIEKRATVEAAPEVGTVLAVGTEPPQRHTRFTDAELIDGRGNPKRVKSKESARSGRLSARSGRSSARSNSKSPATRKVRR